MNELCLPQHSNSGPPEPPRPPRPPEEPKKVPDTNVPKPEPEVPVESMATVDVRHVTEQPPMLSNLAFANVILNNHFLQQNAISKQQAMNQLNITVTGKVINRVSNVSP